MKKARGTITSNNLINLCLLPWWFRGKGKRNNKQQQSDKLMFVTLGCEALPKSNWLNGRGWLWLAPTRGHSRCVPCIFRLIAMHFLKWYPNWTKKLILYNICEGVQSSNILCFCVKNLLSQPWLLTVLKHNLFQEADCYHCNALLLKLTFQRNHPNKMCNSWVLSLQMFYWLFCTQIEFFTF